MCLRREDIRAIDDLVLVRVRASARGKGSGVAVDGTLGPVWTLRAGKGVRIDVSGTWQEALEAVGLRE